MKLFAIEAVPVKQKVTQERFMNAFKLLRGPIPESEIGKLILGCRLHEGLGDHRTPSWETFRQRLMVFTEKRQAEAEARKRQRLNKHWTFKVREVRVIGSEK